MHSMGRLLTKPADDHREHIPRPPSTDKEKENHDTARGKVECDAYGREGVAGEVSERIVGVIFRVGEGCLSWRKLAMGLGVDERAEENWEKGEKECGFVEGHRSKQLAGSV